MGKFDDLTGRKFGRLIAIEYAGSDNGHGAIWKCLCECGASKDVRAKHLKSGSVQSCGCYSKEATSKRKSTHKMTHTRIYNIWKAMRHRCEKTYSASFERYGGRGISVCEEWRNDFQAFFKWAMANGYTDGMSIDRIDNNGNYCPDNCRWVDMVTQANNKRNNHLLTYNGKTQTVAAWSKEIGIGSGTIWRRIRLGWSAEKALAEKVR